MDMAKETAQDRRELADVQALDLLQNACGFEITCCEENLFLENRERYTKLDLAPAQKIQISGLLQQLPQAAAAGAMTQMYVARFPEGLPHTLTALRQGGVGSMIQGADGRIVGHASFCSVSAPAALLGAFTALSAVTGQYFLSKINSELRQIGKKADAILEFLYEDKKAELLSESGFVQYAYQNYSSIMKYTEQRISTIVSLQQAKKVAVKDVEFYLNDFEKKLDAVKDQKGLSSNAAELLNAKDRLELSLRLYVMSGILEAYYAQNFEPDCVEFLNNTVQNYMTKSKIRLLKAFSRLEGHIDGKKGRLWNPAIKADSTLNTPDVRNLLAFSEMLENDAELWPVSQKELHAALRGPTQAMGCVLDAGGNVYVENH